MGSNDDLTEPMDLGVRRKGSLPKRMAIMLIIVVPVIALVVGFNLFSTAQMKANMGKGGLPPATVSTMTAHAEDWQSGLGAVATLRAIRGVDVSTEIAGQVDKVNFSSGSEVATGAVLVELRSDVERAQLESLKAAVELATITLARDREQLTVQAVSQATIDSDESDLRSKTAQQAQAQATLDKKTIRAAFAGKLGISTVAPGQYLNAGDKIVALQAIDPIYADFYVPQEQISRIARNSAVTVTSDAWPGREFEGKVTAINSTIDSSTRNIQVEATVANRDRALLPGMYAKATLQTGGKERYITLPQAAVTYNPYGTTVFLAQPVQGGKAGALAATQVFVTLGPTRGDQVAIVKGVDEGATVVTSGQMKLTNGTPLIVNNTVQPPNNPNPKPQEQ